MALLGNYSVIFKSPGNHISNAGFSNAAPARMNSGALRGRFYGETWLQGTSDRISVPAGYYHPYTFIIAPKSGGLGCNFGIQGLGTLSGLGAMGRYRTADFTGSGSISNAQLGLIVSAVATLAGNSSIGAIMNADLTLIANLAGSGSLTASVRALGNAIATITGTSSIPNTIRATGELEADITPFTPLSPESLARAVWSEVVTNYNVAGTYGKTIKQIKNNTAAGL
jgi:hypothetical protein